MIISETTFWQWLKVRLLLILHKAMTSRKFLLSLGIFVFSCFALWAGKLQGMQWEDFAKYIIGFYLGSQGLVDAAEKLTKNTNQEVK